MKKILIGFMFVWVLLAQSGFAAERGFLYEKKGAYYANFILWNQQGSSIVGKWYEIQIQSDNQYSARNLDLTGSIKGTSLNLTIGTGVYTSSLLGKSLTLSLPSNDGGIDQKNFIESNIKIFNALVNKYKFIALKLQKEAKARLEVLYRIRVLENQISQLYQTSMESINTLKNYELAISKFIKDPIKIYHSDFSTSFESNRIIELMNLADEYEYSTYTKLIYRNCEYATDIEDGINYLKEILILIQDQPNMKSFYEKLVKYHYNRAKSRLDAAKKQSQILKSMILRENINFAIDLNPPKGLLDSRVIELSYQNITRLLKDFDKKVKNSALNRVNEAIKNAEDGLKSLNCPPK